MAMFRIISRELSTTPTDIILKLIKRSEKRFDSVFKKVKLIQCENGKCVAEMKIEKEHVNTINTLHGGLATTIVDTISSFALLTHEKHYMIPSVSVDIHLMYLKAAALGDDIIIDSETLKAGRRLAYLKCVIKDKKTGDILVEGTHVKTFMDNVKPFTELVK